MPPGQSSSRRSVRSSEIDRADDTVLGFDTVLEAPEYQRRGQASITIIYVNPQLYKVK